MTVKELFYSEDQIFLGVQRESYMKEINDLTNNKSETRNLLPLRPFLLDNLLRVGGELDNRFYHFIQNTKLFYQKITRHQHSWYKMPLSKTGT